MGFFGKLFGKKQTSGQTDGRSGSGGDGAGFVQKTVAEQEQRYQEIANGMKRSEPVTDAELIHYFAEYFAPNKEFYSSADSPKGKAYFNAINAAKAEMLKQPGLFVPATGRSPMDLLKSLAEPVPGITSMLICGMIFCMGKYAVIKDHLYCVDFAEQMPNCIALYLLLIAQKEPTNNRKQLIDKGAGVNPAALQAAIESLKVLDAAWQPMIF